MLPIFEDSCEWDFFNNSIQAFTHIPLWTYSETRWALSPSVSFRWDKPLLRNGVLFQAETRSPYFLSETGCQLVEALANGPKTGPELVQTLGERGFVVTFPELIESLQELEARQLAIKGTRAALLSSRAWDRLNSTGLIPPVKDPNTGLVVPGAPFRVNIYLTLHCSLSCKHCGISLDQSRARGSSNLSAEDWQLVFDDLERSAIHTVTLNGGEPLHHPQVANILHDLGRRPFFVRLFTNGVHLTPEIADVCSRGRNLIVSVSIDGPTPDVHDDFRGVRGAFQRTLDGVGMLREAHRPVPFYIATVLHLKNLHHLEQMAELAESLGAIGIAYLTMNYVGRAQTSGYYVSLEKNAALVDRVAQIGAAKAGQLAVVLQGRGPTVRKANSPMPKYRGFENICSCGSIEVSLGPDGEAYPCEACFVLPQSARTKYSLGNVHSQGIRAVWEDQRWSTFRGGIKREDLTKCSTCDLYETCAQRKCRFYSLAGSGHFLGPPPECLPARIMP